MCLPLEAVLYMFPLPLFFVYRYPASTHRLSSVYLAYPAVYLVVISVARDLELLYSVFTERTLDLRQYQLSKASSSKKRSRKEFEDASGCVAMMTTTIAPANHSQGSRFGSIVRRESLNYSRWMVGRTLRTRGSSFAS